jgi:hypothetical protein
VTARVLYVGCAFLFVIQSSDSRRFYREATEQSGQTSHHVKLPSVSPSLNIMNPQLPSYQFAQEVTPTGIAACPICHCKVASQRPPRPFLLNQGILHDIVS